LVRMQAAKVPIADDKNDRPRSRRRPVGAVQRNDEDNGDEKIDRPPRRPYKSVPEDFLGKTYTGKVVDVIKRFRSTYGFILINLENVLKSERPKIYFNNKDYDDADFVIRKGYDVEFKVAKDENNRLYASDLILTAAGKVAAAAREERIKAGVVPGRDHQPRTEKPATTTTAAGDGAAAPVRKPRRPRPPANETAVVLQVACEGKTEIARIETKIFQSIGKLKYAAVEHFGVPDNYTIYCQRTPENPNGVMLNKSIMRSLQDNDMVFIGPPPPSAAVEA